MFDQLDNVLWWSDPMWKQTETINLWYIHGCIITLIWPLTPPPIAFSSGSWVIKGWMDTVLEVLKTGWNCWAQKRAILTSPLWLVRSAVSQKSVPLLLLFSIFICGMRSQSTPSAMLWTAIRGQNDTPINIASIQTVWRTWGPGQVDNLWFVLWRKHIHGKVHLWKSTSMCRNAVWKFVGGGVWRWGTNTWFAVLGGAADPVERLCTVFPHDISPNFDISFILRTSLPPVCKVAGFGSSCADLE